MTSSFRLCVSSQPHAISRDELTAEQDHSSPLIDQRTMNSSSMVGPPMKYPDISVVLRYLPVEKRRDLARKAPFLRTLNKKMPYNFKKIDLTLYHVKKTKWEVRIDSLTWRFEYFKDDTGITIKMCNPEGHSVNLAQNGPVNRICQYYMDRAGTLIDHMSILNYNASKFVNNHPIKIKLLKAKYTKNYYKSGLFREFRNAKFKSIEVENHTSRNNAIFEDLREIKTDVLRIWTNAASEESILELRPLKRFDCCEDASLDDDRFQKFCEKLKNESMLESAYSCILYSRNFLPNGFLTEMLNEFGGEEKYLNGRKCVTAPTVNPDHELNICCDNKVYIGELPRNQLTVRVMKKGSSKKREETNVLNRARFNARSIFIRLLSLLLIALKNHLVRHNSLVHARFILIPMMMFTATNIESVIELLILVAATWFTWEAFMGFYQLMLYPPVTRLCYRIPNQRIARVVWALAISPVFFTTALAWGLSMFIIQTGLYTFHRYRDMYLRDYVYDD